MLSILFFLQRKKCPLTPTQRKGQNNFFTYPDDMEIQKMRLESRHDNKDMAWH
jgi:hypothetical protein